MEKFNIKLKNRNIEYILNRKKIKNMIIKIKQDKTISISAPLKVKDKEIEVFLKEKINWILKQLDELDKIDIKSKSEETINFNNEEKIYFKGNLYNINLIISEKEIIELSKEKKDTIDIYISKEYSNDSKYKQYIYELWANEMLDNLIKKYLNEFNYILIKYNIKTPTVRYKKLKSRWGACFCNKNLVEFNTILVKVPVECIKYVVLHELVHFIHQNHSKDFQDVLDIYMPNWKKIKKKLNQEYGMLV